MKKFYLYFKYFNFILLLSIAAGNSLPPGGTYDLNDWITFKNCNHLTSIAQGRDYIYFGTTGGIVPFERNGQYITEPYTVSDGLKNDFITAVLYDETTDYIWASHKNGVSFLTPTASQWENIDLSNYITQGSPINRLGVSDNFIWATSSGGFIFKIDRNTGSLIGQFDSGELTKNIKWGITKESPLPEINDYFIDPNNYSIDDQHNITGPEFREFKINLFYKNSRQNIFGGAWGLGLLIGDSNIRDLSIKQFGPLNNYITNLAQTEKYLIMANNQSKSPGERAGISLFKPENLSWNYIEPKFIMEFPTNQIYDIAYDNKEIWFGTDQGVVVQNKKNNSFRHLSIFDNLPGDEIHTIALDDSIAWVGSQIGMGIVYRDSHTIKEVSLTSENIQMKIHKIDIGEKHIWVGTDNGLYSINKTNLVVTHYNARGEKLGNDQVTPTTYPAIASNDSLVIAYGFNNFLKYNTEDQKWNYISDIPDVSSIYEITLSQNHLWVGTDNGAYLIELDSDYRKHYTYKDGLAGRHVFQVMLRGNHVWFGTNQGLTKFYWTKYVFKK